MKSKDVFFLSRDVDCKTLFVVLIVVFFSFSTNAQTPCDIAMHDTINKLTGEGTSLTKQYIELNESDVICERSYILNKGTNFIFTIGNSVKSDSPVRIVLKSKKEDYQEIVIPVAQYRKIVFISPKTQKYSIVAEMENGKSGCLVVELSNK